MIFKILTSNVFTFRDTKNIIDLKQIFFLILDSQHLFRNFYLLLQQQLRLPSQELSALEEASTVRAKLARVACTEAA